MTQKLIDFWKKVKPILTILFYILIAATGIYIIYLVIHSLKNLIQSPDTKNAATLAAEEQKTLDNGATNQGQSTNTKAYWLNLAENIYQKMFETALKVDDETVKQWAKKLHNYYDVEALNLAYNERSDGLFGWFKNRNLDSVMKAKTSPIGYIYWDTITTELNKHR